MKKNNQIQSIVQTKYPSQNDAGINIEKATFKSSSNLDIIESQVILQTISTRQWCLYHKVYFKQQWKYIFEQMTKSEVQILHLNANFYNSIIKQIQNVDFIKLRSLTLHDNNIDNIQVLSLIGLQNLQILHICNNYITTINCLAKLSTNSLYFITLSMNPVKQITCLTKVKFKQRSIKLHLKNSGDDIYDYNSSQYFIKEKRKNLHLIRNLGYLLKLNIRSIKEAFIGSRYELTQKKVKEMIKNKHSNTKFCEYDI